MKQSHGPCRECGNVTALGDGLCIKCWDRVQRRRPETEVGYISKGGRQLERKPGRPELGEWHNCVDCGKEIYVQRSRLEKNPKAGQRCGECYSIYLKKHRRRLPPSKTGRKWKKKQGQWFTCVDCHGNFYVRKSKLKDHPDGPIRCPKCSKKAGIPPRPLWIAGKRYSQHDSCPLCGVKLYLHLRCAGCGDLIGEKHIKRWYASKEGKIYCRRCLDELGDKP